MTRRRTSRLTDKELVIISPHSPEIRAEFSRGFSRWYQKQTGKTGAVNWLDIGGTGESIEYIRSRNAEKRQAGGVDIFFGGGNFPFFTLEKAGLLARHIPPDSIISHVPPDINGSPIIGNDSMWYGAAISGFGIIYNKNLVPPERSNKLIIIKTAEISFILLSHIPAYLARDSELALMTDAIGFFIMIIDMAIFIPYGEKAFKNAKEKAFGKIYIYIGIMCFFMFNTAIMFLLDRVTMVLEIPGPFGELGYTVFYFLGWTSVIVAMIFAMFGFIQKKQI